MELRHLRYFVAVAGELHFGRAAAKLNISQPPLSQQIQDLERELGVELLHRTRRFVALTEAGRVFLEEARRILEEADHAVATARKAGRGEAGQLSIGFGHASAAGILGRILSAFRERHPTVTVDLHTLHSVEQVDALVNRRIDVAFPILPVSHRNIAAEAIGTEPLIVALPSDHPQARNRWIALADLRPESFIRLSPSAAPMFHDLIQKACAGAGFVPAVVHEAGHILTVLGLVGAGLGVAVVPGWLRTRPSDGVVFRSLSGAPTIKIGVAYRRRDSSPLLPAFLDVVRSASRPRSVRSLRASVGA
jgi:DNA-binding transcriptional LysR family regulator